MKLLAKNNFLNPMGIIWLILALGWIVIAWLMYFSGSDMLLFYYQHIFELIILNILVPLLLGVLSIIFVFSFAKVYLKLIAGLFGLAALCYTGFWILANMIGLGLVGVFGFGMDAKEINVAKSPYDSHTKAELYLQPRIAYAMEDMLIVAVNHNQYFSKPIAFIPLGNVGIDAFNNFKWKDKNTLKLGKYSIPTQTKHP